MKSILIAAALMMTITASAQGTTEQAAEATGAKTQAAAKKTKKEAAKKAAKKSSKKGAQADKLSGQKVAMVEGARKEEPMIVPVAKNSAEASTSAAAVDKSATINQSTTTAEAVKPAEAKKWGAEVAFVTSSDAKLAFQDAEQAITAYGAVKYKMDAKNAFALRQYGSMTAVGSDSKAGSVSTGKALNTMLVYNRMVGQVMGSDEAGTLLQTRLTIPTNDKTAYDIAALSATLVLPYTINPKWSAEYGVRIGTPLNSNSAKAKLTMPVNYAQIAYNLTDTLALAQQVALTNGDNLGMADSWAFEPATSISYVPSPNIYMDFSINQSHGVGAGATQFKMYDVAESKYGATLMFIY